MERNVNDRMIVIMASPEKLNDLNKTIDWKTAIKIGLITGIPGLLYERYIKEPTYPYPVFDIMKARNRFEFPINHPIDGQVYACCEASSCLYVPLSSFHQYMYESKMAAFLGLCSDLGARCCKVAYAEENGVDISAKIGASGIPTEMGPASGNANCSSEKHNSSAASVFAEFPRPKNPTKGSSSKWMNGEPTWIMMQESRLGNGIDKIRAEFTYEDDFGINAEVAADINKIGLSIGGEYKGICKRKWVFDVEFWPC